MIKELNYVFYIFIIFFFTFFISRYYFSDDYKKKSYRSLSNIDERIKSPTSGSFDLKDQNSENLEFGIRYSNSKIQVN